MAAINELYDKLQVIDATQGGWKEAVMRSLGARTGRSLMPMKAILDQAHELGTRTVVLEQDYVDSDFLDEFKTYYARQFRSWPARCTRLHFFESVFAHRDIPDLDLAEQGYVGFSVVRPISSFCSGRTVMRSPKDDGHSMFALCKAGFEANLVGNRLTVLGMPFTQQDTNVGVCAEAAMWMASLYMHQKFGYTRFRPSEITKAATRSITVGPARTGLIKEQMLAALRDMGFNPLLFTHYDTDRTARIIYAYVESELPVIVLLEIPIANQLAGHAVVAVGHDFCTRNDLGALPDSNIGWIDGFFVHDDASGPHRSLSIRGPAGHYSVEQHARHVIVPVPPGVSMQANDVFIHVNVLIEHLDDLIGLFPGTERARLSLRESADLVFRTYLRLSNHFKVNLPSGMGSFFRHVYKSMRMPRYVWVTEIAYSRDINKEHSGERRIVGEIIIDSTADRHSELDSYLAVHILGRMIVRRPDEGAPYAFYFDPAEQPYGHLVR